MAIELGIVGAMACYLLVDPVLAPGVTLLRVVPSWARAAAQVIFAVAVLSMPTTLMGARLPAYPAARRREPRP